MDRTNKNANKDGAVDFSQAVLRLQAEGLVRDQEPQQVATDESSASALRSALHELQVHQIELEIQNEELRGAQLAMDAVRARYFDIYDLAPVGYCSVDEHGLILESNLTAANLLGVSRGELPGQPMSRFIVAEHQDVYYRQCRQLKASGQAQSCELLMVKCDGTQIWVYVSLGIERNIEGVSALRITMNDVTERKSAEMELRASDSLYRSILDSVPAHIAVLDCDGVIVAVNHLWQRFAQENSLWPGEPVPGTSIGCNYLAACRSGTPDAAAAGEGIQRVLDGRLPIFELEYPCHSPDVERWFHMSVTPRGSPRLGAVIAHTDITTRRRAEADLLRGKQRLNGIINSAMDAIITVDQNQNIVLFNAAAANIFGYSETEAMGLPLSRLIPERFQTPYTQMLNCFDASYVGPRRMGDSARRTIRGRRRTGEEFPIEASISRLVEGGVNFYTVILRDITDIRRAEEELHRSQLELNEFGEAARLSRERDKSRVARELHDELGQALTALKMDVMWLKQHPEINVPQRQNKLENMLHLLDNTVAATRRIASDLRPLILDDLGLGPALEWLAAEFREHSGIHCELAIASSCVDLPEPHATALFRIVQESLTNVAKHAHASRVNIFLSKRDENIALTVSDNGCGFETGKPRKPNSFGLVGLRERVKLLNGTIEIKSVSSGGATGDAGAIGHVGTIGNVETTKDVGTTIKVQIPVAMDRVPT